MAYTSTKIVHLTSVHPAFDVRIFHKECVTLAEAGYAVVLLAQHKQHETVGGVRIRAIPASRSQLRRMTLTVAQVLRAALDEDAALYHFHDPELIPVGIILRALGKRVIYDVHENVPEDILTKEYIPLGGRRLVASAMGMLERLASRLFDAIVVVTPAIGSRFPQAKTVMIRNLPVVQEWLYAEPKPYTERPPWIIYAGRISVDRGIGTMVQAMGMLPERLKARLVLAGVFTPQNLVTAVEKIRGWDQTDFRGWLSRGELKALFAEARIGLVPIHPRLSYLSSYPVKLFEYMAAGIPVIASDFRLWREIIEEVGCGLLVDPMDPHAIADAMEWLLEHPQEAEAMGERGRQAVRSRFNWMSEAGKLRDIYEVLLAK